jgi:hypothetical protein
MNPNPTQSEGQEHNPDGLTPEQYEAPEWRLLAANEVLQLGDEWLLQGKWIAGASVGKTVVDANCQALTYRRRITPPPANKAGETGTEGSCLICGHAGPFAVRSMGAGVCAECRHGAQSYADTKRDLDNAQQWIDSEPDWKEKYNANYAELEAQVAGKDADYGALVWAINRVLYIDKKQGGVISTASDEELAEVADEIKADPDKFKSGTYLQIAEQTHAIINLRQCLASASGQALLDRLAKLEADNASMRKELELIEEIEEERISAAEAHRNSQGL